MQATLGPLMPFLREELSLNYTIAGLHFSGFALGMIIAGTNGEQLAGRFGRKNLFWWGAAGMSLAALILTMGQSAFLTILSAFMMGFVGTYLLVMIQALLSDEFGEQRAIPLTEANLGASIFASLSPLVVAISPAVGLDWRLALWLGGILFLLALVTQYEVKLPEVKGDMADTDETSSKLPPIFRLYWLIIFIGVAIEWCMVFWLADFLISVAGLASTLASSLVSVFLGSMIVGRLAGSRLTRDWSVISLLLGMTILIMPGFFLFWLGQSLLLKIPGLVIIGLGMANLFPLGLSAASNAGAVDVNKASARVSQAAGFAILIVPQTLGTLADRFGIFRAYAVLPLLLLILISLIIFVFYMEKEQTPP